LKTLAGLYLHQQDGVTVEFKSKYGFGMGTSSIYGNYTSLSAVWLG
jgi:hypothetical protein